VKLAKHDNYSMRLICTRE